MIQYNRALVENKSEAKIVREIFRYLSLGIHPNIVRSKVNNQYNINLGLARFDNLAHNTIYYGVFTGVGVTIENFCIPIIDKNLFELAQQMISTHAKHTYLYFGKVYCSECVRVCDHHCAYGKNKRLYKYYVCPVCNTYYSEVELHRRIWTIYNTENYKIEIDKEGVQRDKILKLYSRNAITYNELVELLNEAEKIETINGQPNYSVDKIKRIIANKKGKKIKIMVHFK